jgi:hypothetical protein
VGTKTIGGEYPLEGRSTAAAREGNEYTPKAEEAFGQRTIELFYIGPTVPSVTIAGVFIGDCSPTPTVITLFYPSITIFLKYSKGTW